jgi:hypothetical protein
VAVHKLSLARGRRASITRRTLQQQCGNGVAMRIYKAKKTLVEVNEGGKSE